MVKLKGILWNLWKYTTVLYITHQKCYEFWHLNLNRMFFNSNGFEVNGINDNQMVQGQKYTVDETSLLSLTRIFFCEWRKMYVVWRYLDERWRLYELSVPVAFPWFLCPIPLAGDSRHSNWQFGSFGAAQNKQYLWNPTKHSA